MSRIDLTQADQEPLTFQERLRLPAAAGEDVVSVGELELSGLITRSERGYTLDGEVRGEATLRCGRCLIELPFAFDEPMHVELRPASAAPREEETQLARGELDVRFFTEPEIDAADLAAEQLELALPMKPLCDEACKGLCPRCGANLNEGPCTCPEESDERWSPLAGWRPDRQ